MTYHGGHVLANVKIDLVIWDTWSYSNDPRTGAPLYGTRSVSSFLSNIVRSPLIDWLSEYNTPQQRIGRGSLEGIYTIHPSAANNPATLSPYTIETVLKNKINAGALPGNGPNRLYMIYLPNGKQISISNACAYHSYTNNNGNHAYYAVMPYNVNRGGCRKAIWAMDDLTSSSSHELFEAITDPALSAWYTTNTAGEISDKCNWWEEPTFLPDGQIYIAQRQWSNRYNRCIVYPGFD